MVDQDQTVRAPTAGHTSPTLNICVGRSRCGDIVDGVVMWFQGEGAFVISWDDFKRAYDLNAAARAAQPMPPIGSRWRDQDKRMSGRIVTVVGYEGEKAIVEDSIKRRTRISAKRFGTTSGGFEASV